MIDLGVHVGGTDSLTGFDVDGLVGNDFVFHEVPVDGI